MVEKDIDESVFWESLGEDDFDETIPVSEEGLYEHHRIIVDKGQGLVRIDRFLTDKIANATRNKVQDALEEGYIKVNDHAVKSNYKIKPNDIIVVSLPTPPHNTEMLPEDLELDIVYEDDDLIIINKAVGMVVHPAHGNWTGTLVNALLYHFSNLPTNSSGYPGLVHRIDKDTTGLMVIAKNEVAIRILAKQFFDHTIERSYQALVWGNLKEESGTIDAPLTRSASDRRIIEVSLKPDLGKKAITHYKVIRDFRYVSLIECKLETGRTHQIRAHLKYLGHPLFGDPTYGGDKILKGTQTGQYKNFVENCFKIIPRQALHAKSLGFIHPITEKEMFFDSELPKDFSTVLEKWENYVKYH